jgi:predicted metal-dependent peptidase
MDASRRIQRAKVQLGFNCPFFASLLFNCDIINVKGTKLESEIQTMATDGVDLFYSEQFVDDLPEVDGSKDSYLQGILCHEVMHKVFMHCEATRGRDLKRFNVAADYIINDFITKCGMKLPEGCLIDPDYNHDNWTSDAVYEDIVTKFDPNAPDLPNHLIGNGSGTNQGKDSKSKNQAPTSDQLATKKAEMDQQLASARDAAKNAGKCPDAVEKLVEDIIQPKVDWRAKLREFIQMTGKNDVTWRRPSRRGVAHGMYLPILESEECPHLCVIFDTSGSIYSNEKIVTAFLSELNGIIEDCPPNKLTILHTDTQVAYEEELEPGDMVTNKFHGGGGTDFNAVMDHVADLDEAPAAVIFFTDLYCGSSYGKDPDVPVHWMVYDNPTPDAPFGEITVMED